MPSAINETQFPLVELRLSSVWHIEKPNGPGHRFCLHAATSAAVRFPTQRAEHVDLDDFRSAVENDDVSLYDSVFAISQDLKTLFTYRGPLSGYQIYALPTPDGRFLISDDPAQCYDCCSLGTLDKSPSAAFRVLTALYIAGAAANSFGASIHSSLVQLCGSAQIRVYTISAAGRLALEHAVPFEPSTCTDQLNMPDIVQERINRLCAASAGLLFELSGGIDSAIVGYHIARSSFGLSRNAVHVRYPYWEFRRELGFVEEVRGRLAVPLIQFDGSSFGEFDAIENPFYTPEPMLGAIANANYYTNLIRLCVETGADTILTGAGGDLVYSNESFNDWDQVSMPEAADWGHPFARAFEHFCNQNIRLMKASLLSPAAKECSLLDNPAGNLFFARHGVRFESGFASWPLIRSAQSRRLGKCVLPKELARRMYAGKLPDSIISRPGKVNHVGLERRSLLKQFDAIEALIMESEEFISQFGITGARLLGLLSGWRAGTKTEGRLFTCLIGICAWRRAFTRRVFAMVQR